MLYRFDEFTLDVSDLSLRQNGNLINLSSRAFEILQFLLERNGEVVTKNELLEKVWRNSFVEEANIPVQISALRRILGEKKGEARFIKTISGRGYRFVGQMLAESARSSDGPTDKARADEPLSVAVLPFRVSGGTDETEFLSAGVTQSLISDLAMIEDIRVLAYSSVRPFADSALDVSEIAFLLGANHVLTGSISEFRGQRKLSAELIECETSRCLWGIVKPVDGTNVFELERTISLAVMEELKTRLNGRKLQKKIDPEARNSYQRGFKILETRDSKGDLRETLYRAARFFDDAIRVQPDYALAHIGIGSVYVSLHNHKLIGREEARQRAMSALEKALQCDRDLSDAWVLKASIETFFDLDPRAAKESVDRAIALNSNNANAYSWKSVICNSLGEFESAEHNSERAISLDPSSNRFNSNLIRVFFLSRNFVKTISAAIDLLDFNEGSVSALYFLALSHAYLGNAQQARECLSQLVSIRQNSEMVLMEAFLYSLLGESDRCRAMLEDFLKSRPFDDCDDVDLAVVYTGLGEYEKAIDYLEGAMEERSPGLLPIHVDMRFDSLRTHPRFQRLLENLKF